MTLFKKIKCPNGEDHQDPDCGMCHGEMVFYVKADKADAREILKDSRVSDTWSTLLGFFIMVWASWMVVMLATKAALWAWNL